MNQVEHRRTPDGGASTVQRSGADSGSQTSRPTMSEGDIAVAADSHLSMPSGDHHPPTEGGDGGGGGSTAEVAKDETGGGGSPPPEGETEQKVEDKKVEDKPEDKQLKDLKMLIARKGPAWGLFSGLALNVAETVWQALEGAERLSMAGRLSHDLTKGAQAHLKAAFTKTGDGELATLIKLFEARFNVSVGQSKHQAGADFDAAGIKRCWEVLEPLPPKHVEGNTWLEHWTRYTGGGSGSGYYAEGDKESSVAYDPAKMNDPNNAADDGDPLKGVVRFNKVVRHEIGHAVDKKIGGSALTSTETGGGWEEHGTNHRALLNTMVAASGGAVSTWAVPSEKDDLLEVLYWSMRDGTPGSWQGVLLGAGWTNGEITQVKTDPAVQTLDKCGTNKNPWYRLGDGGVDVGGRHYQASYGTTWVSYKKSARDKKVSTYQWRAPGEWFAEVYATYYEPDPKGKVGTILEARDSASKKWFDNNVHNK